MKPHPPSILEPKQPAGAAGEAPPAGSRGAELALVLFFLALVASSLVVQTAYELWRGGGVQALEVFNQRPTSTNLRVYEHNLEDASVVARALRPLFQFAQFAWLRDGGEKALIGRDGWLFYKPGFDYMVAGDSGLSTATNDPVPAILEFRDALAACGIHLLVVPAPNKESVYPDKLTRRVPAGQGVISPATQDVLARLQSAGVECVDLFREYAEARTNAAGLQGPPLYLAQDSHWSPAGLALAVKAVARRLVERGWVKPGATDYDDRSAPVERVGDVLRMLQVPRLERGAVPEHVACVQVVRHDNAQAYQDDPNSTVLVLGDSFLRIYEQDEPGAAGFIAHLAKELKQPVTSLVSDGGASTLVRQELYRRPALLKNKKVVVWEFVERDIRQGTEGWQPVPLPALARQRGRAELAACLEPRRSRRQGVSPKQLVGRACCAPAPYTHRATHVDHRKPASSWSGCASAQTPEGWPVYRRAGTQHAPSCFWAARPPGNVGISMDPARPRCAKTKRRLERVRVYTQATPPGFEPSKPAVAAEMRVKYRCPHRAASIQTCSKYGGLDDLRRRAEDSAPYLPDGSVHDLQVHPDSTGSAPAEDMRFRKVRLSWGHESKTTRPFQMRLLTNEVAVMDLKPVGFQAGDILREGVAQTRAGAGHVDGLDFTLAFPDRTVREIRNLQQIWAYLFAHSEADTVRRLQLDPAFRPDTRKLTVQMNAEGTQGFSVTVDQLLTSKNFWLPELDVFLSAGEAPVTFTEHKQQLKAQGGERVLAQLEREPEATYEGYTSRWEDMGNPAYHNPASVPPGHIICVAWDSAIHKFGIDRGANVWSDYGNPDHFHFGYDFGGLSPGLVGSWKGQKLANGLPVITTTIERDGIRYEVEQFAYPLHGPPAERRGDLDMVLLQKVRLTELSGQARTVSLGMTHRRELPAADVKFLARTNGTALVWEEANSNRLLLALQGEGFTLQSNAVHGAKWQTNQIVLGTALPAHGTRELVVKLPSPLVAGADREAFLELDYATSREGTLRFWSDYLARGAQFVVPEAAVNDLFRANLWHALRLPRRHGGEEPNVKIDLPYSNFAYDQNGTPWPVNQSVYVNYMLYELRGYHAVSAEELAAMYRNNLEPNGHVGGFANWGVYTPGMIYSVAQHYLLSGDRASLEQLLPQTLKALDWCLGEMREAAERGSPASGLVLAPLNDLSHDANAWAFNQAYLFAGPELLGRVLASIQHPRARECQAAARAMHEAVQRGFAHATMLSPLVQLRDQTWVPYVPCDALTPRRLLDVWYPTDVDCGALHLARLKAIDPNGPLTDYLLNDHEDNLFLNHWGMANEPVYNPHATAYLLRDEVKPAIRAFYSMMACAFSHSTFEPVEHRWGWGQYFGPPSTDGAWFELYRQMLIRERDDDALMLLQATPRKWLDDGKEIHIQHAPTYYGRLNFTLASHAASGEISATIDLEPRGHPAVLFLGLRHPQGQPMKAVLVNGKEWTDFDAAKEWVRIPSPRNGHYEVVARY